VILGWDSPPFVIPEKDQGTSARQAWAERVAQTPEALRREFERRNEGKLPHGWR
jgi:transketolase